MSPTDERDPLSGALLEHGLGQPVREVVGVLHAGHLREPQCVEQMRGPVRRMAPKPIGDTLNGPSGRVSIRISVCSCTAELEAVIDIEVRAVHGQPHDSPARFRRWRVAEW